MNPAPVAIGGEGISIRYDSGNAASYRANESSVFLTPRGFQPDGTRRGIILLHGASQAPSVYIPPDSANLAFALARRGFPVFVPEAGGLTPFGNSTHMDGIDAAVTYMKAQGVKDKVVLVGGSMGSLGALNYAVRNPQNVSSLILWLPALDMDDLHTGTFDRNASIKPWSNIETAYGQTPGGSPDLSLTAVWRTAAVPAYSPNHRRADFKALVDGGMPIHMFSSSTDNVTPQSIAESFANEVGANHSSYGDAGHSSYGFDAQRTVEDLWANGALK